MTTASTLAGIEVYGESAEQITIALKNITTIDRDGSMYLEGEVDGPLIRAILRAQAALLLEDADAMAKGTYVHRTESQRFHDALLSVGKAIRAQMDGQVT